MPQDLDSRTVRLLSGPKTLAVHYTRYLPLPTFLRKPLWLTKVSTEEIEWSVHSSSAIYYMSWVPVVSPHVKYLSGAPSAAFYCLLASVMTHIKVIFSLGFLIYFWVRWFWTLLLNSAWGPIRFSGTSACSLLLTSVRLMTMVPVHPPVTVWEAFQIGLQYLVEIASCIIQVSLSWKYLQSNQYQYRTNACIFLAVLETSTFLWNLSSFILILLIITPDHGNLWIKISSKERKKNYWRWNNLCKAFISFTLFNELFTKLSKSFGINLINCLVDCPLCIIIFFINIFQVGFHCRKMHRCFVVDFISFPISNGS